MAYYEGCQLEGRAGKPTVDVNALKNLKARMSRRQTSASSTTASGSQVYDESFGFGNFSVPKSKMSRCASAPGLGKDEVEGSRPRIWKPSKAPRAPPGGAPTFHPAKDGNPDPLCGRKRFPDMGAGTNRDANAIEALRFYQDSERLGKLSGPKPQPKANKNARDSHRYYLAAEGNADLTPGKARCSSSTTGSKLYGLNHERMASQSTSAGCSSDELPSECDSLPLGAEWSSCRFDSARGHSIAA